MPQSMRDVLRPLRELPVRAEQKDSLDHFAQPLTKGVERVILVRQVKSLYALLDQCAHQGGPLHEGKVEDGCVICPWHSSRYRLSDGVALSGPTAHPQPTLQVRLSGGKVEVRR